MVHRSAGEASGTGDERRGARESLAGEQLPGGGKLSVWVAG